MWLACCFIKLILTTDNQLTNEAGKDLCRIQIFTNADLNTYNSLFTTALIMLKSLNDKYKFLPKEDIVKYNDLQKVESKNKLLQWDKKCKTQFIKKLLLYLELSKKEFSFLFKKTNRACASSLNRINKQHKNGNFAMQCHKHTSDLISKFKNFTLEQYFEEKSIGYQDALLEDEDKLSLEKKILPKTVLLILKSLFKSLVDDEYCVPCILTDFYIKRIVSNTVTLKNERSRQENMLLSDCVLLNYYRSKHKNVIRGLAANKDGTRQPMRKEDTDIGTSKQQIFFYYDPCFLEEHDLPIFLLFKHDQRVCHDKKINNYEIEQKEIIDLVYLSCAEEKYKCSNPITYIVGRETNIEDWCVMFYSCYMQDPFFGKIYRKFRFCLDNLHKFAQERYNTKVIVTEYGSSFAETEKNLDFNLQSFNLEFFQTMISRETVHPSKESINEFEQTNALINDNDLNNKRSLPNQAAHPRKIPTEKDNIDDINAKSRCNQKDIKNSGLNETDVKIN
ncbi:hypothetical protein COBT_000587 [Conglomerata obtusa]